MVGGKGHDETPEVYNNTTRWYRLEVPSLIFSVVVSIFCSSSKRRVEDYRFSRVLGPATSLIVPPKCIDPGESWCFGSLQVWAEAFTVSSESAECMLVGVYLLQTRAVSRNWLQR